MRGSRKAGRKQATSKSWQVIFPFSGNKEAQSSDQEAEDRVWDTLAEANHVHLLSCRRSFLSGLM